MKKLLILLIALTSFQMASTVNAANIKIKVGGIQDNRYFLCLPSVGCLSMKAAQKGKVYPIHNTFKVSQLFVTDRGTQRLSPQAAASSCNAMIESNQTVTISGQLSVQTDNSVRINQLHCSIS
jgi:hypothetical protein